MTRGGGGVQTPPKKDDIIYEQPLTLSKRIYMYSLKTLVIKIWNIVMLLWNSLFVCLNNSLAPKAWYLPGMDATQTGLTRPCIKLDQGLKRVHSTHIDGKENIIFLLSSGAIAREALLWGQGGGKRTTGNFIRHQKTFKPRRFPKYVAEAMVTTPTWLYDHLTHWIASLWPSYDYKVGNKTMY